MMTINVRFWILWFMSMLFGWGWAMPINQEELNVWWATSSMLRLSETGYFIGEDPVHFDDGHCGVSLRSGVLIPVISGQAFLDERIVGVTFVGEGTLTHRFPETADALRFANHMARYTKSGLSLESLVQDGAPLTLPIDRGMILSVDPQVVRMLTELEPLGAGIRITEGEDGFNEEYVVNLQRRQRMKRAISSNVLVDRSRYLRGTGLDPAAIIRQDRLLYDKLGVPGEQLRVVSDFRTSQRFYVTERREQFIGGKGNDRWLTCYRDDSDLANTGFRTMSFTHGVDADRRRQVMRLGGESRPRPDEPPQIRRMVGVHAETEITAKIKNNGASVQANVRSTLRVRATGGALQHLMLKLPVGISLSGTWKLDSIQTLDGTPLPFVEIYSGLRQNVFGSRIHNGTQSARDAERLSRRLQRDNRDDEAQIVQRTGKDPETKPFRDITREVLIVLPAPITDEEQEVVLAWQTRWPYHHIIEVQGHRDGGHSTGPQPFLPEILPVFFGNGWDHHTVLRLEGDERAAAVISGRAVRHKAEDDSKHVYFESEGKRQRTPRLAIGRWQGEVAAPGPPLTQIHLFDEFGAWDVRSMIQSALTFLQSRLGAFPVEFPQVFQDVHVVNERFSLPGAGNGLIRIQAIFHPRRPEMRPTLAGIAAQRGRSRPLIFMVVRQVAQRFWEERYRFSGPRDAWLVDALSEALALAFLDAAAFETNAARRTARIRGQFESVRDDVTVATNAFDPRPARRGVRTFSPSTPEMFNDAPTTLRQFYGTQVFAHMLRVRVGEPSWQEAITDLVQLPPGTVLDTARVREVFEARAQRDLSDFFDYWVHGGYLPAITVAAREHDRRMEGCVQSDVSFGTFEIPIRLVDSEDNLLEEALVTVQNGQGSFSLPVSADEPTLQIDPDHWTLTRSRTLKMDARPDCTVQ